MNTGKVYLCTALIALALYFVCFYSAFAHACEIRIIVVNGEMQTWQVCCPNGMCQYTRIG